MTLFQRTLIERRETDDFNLAWPIVAMCFGVAANLLINVGEFSLIADLLILPSIALTIGVVCFWLSLVLGDVARRCWRRLLSRLIAAPIAILCWSVFGTNLDLAAELRLTLEKGDLDRQIAALLSPSGQRRATWDWGGTTTAVTGGMLNTLVYDETASLPGDIQAGHGWPREGPPRLNPLDSRVEDLGGHFYLVQDFVP